MNSKMTDGSAPHNPGKTPLAARRAPRQWTALVGFLISAGLACAQTKPEEPSMPWKDATYRTDIPSTQAMSRPGPGENGWPLWMKHHEDRKSWVGEKPVYWLDIGQTFLDEEGKIKRDLMPDALHPNIPGYRAWALAMEPTLKKLLGEAWE